MPDGQTVFQLRLPGFDGPISELLRLAVEKRIDVDSVRASDITAQVARYVAESDGVDLEDAGEAISAAARILALKSGRLLLQESAEELPISDPAERPALIDPESMRGSAASLRLLEGRESFPLPGVPELLDRRIEPRSPALLARAWAGIHLRSHEAAARVSLPSFLRLETAISGLIRALRTQSRLSFHRLTAQSTRQDAVVHFLAVLELCRRREAAVAQPDLFGDITIQSTEREAGADGAIRAG